MSIEENIKEIQEDLEIFEDETQKYEYIIDIGKTLNPLDNEFKIDENLVKGCSSKVWIIYEKIDNKYIFHFDSDAIIVKGLCKIVQTLFNNQTKEEILNCKLEVLSALGIQSIISQNRQNGVKGMFEKIKGYVQND